jgi:hypothetical protein
MQSRKWDEEDRNNADHELGVWRTGNNVDQEIQEKKKLSGGGGNRKNGTVDKETSARVLKATASR